MRLLAYIMGQDSWNSLFFLNDFHSRIINHAHRLGLVYRGSHSQVYWTERGAELYKKYIKAEGRS